MLEECSIVKQVVFKIQVVSLETFVPTQAPLHKWVIKIKEALQPTDNFTALQAKDPTHSCIESVFLTPA